MASRFQAVTLVASPSYPNSVAWSDENLLAVASGHIVTILNPSKLYGPRGLIVLPPSKPFRIGVIKREDLLSGCLLPTCLSRDCRPCVRSISWSPLGLAPNYGCLLAVCTTEGRVKLYRMPFCEFSAEWVELMDLSDMLLDYLVNINFLELNSSSQSCGEQTTDVHMGSGCEDDLPIAVLKKKHKQTRANKWSAVNKDLGTPELQFLHHCNSKNVTTGSTCQTENHFIAFLEDKIFPCSILQESPLVEVLRLDGSRRVWVPGILECCTGVKAHAMFREIDGKHDELVEIDLEDDEICGDFCKNSGATGSNKFPKVRPSIHLGNLPENLASSIGVEKYLSIGQAVEVWTNNRWVEGLFMGFDKARLLVKFCGDHDSVILSPNSVRLAPVWISDRESWRVTVVKIEMKGQELPEVAVMNSKAKGINPSQIVQMPESEVERLKEIPENCSFPQITADEYASRTKLLSSLVVAWLPTLLLSSESVPVPLSNSSKCCSLLAIGGKSGKISFWRINGPHHYSIENGGIKNAAMLVGLLHAHDAWITTIDWASLASDASNSRVLLATGSSDGSVKLWIGSCEGLLKSSEVNYAPFLLLYEVSLVGSISVSVLSVVCPPQDQHKNILAIGRVSGSFEVWICDLSTSKFDKVGSYDVHDRVVTGLAWAFDGNCLYSCGQDYSVRGWILHKRSLFEATIPSNNLDAKCSVDIPNASDSCFGVDVSSGNMVLAVARSLDAELLDPMYQARTMKAVIDFFWIGGQQSDNLLHKKIGIEAFPGFSEEELVYWEYNILRSLNQHAHGEKPLVVWDITAALLALKQGAPKFVELILVKWISRSFGGSHLRLSIEEMLTHTSKLTSKITSRQLQLLNIICRRVVLLEFKAEVSNRQQKDLETCAEEEKINFWMKLLLSCENELRGRLVGFSMSAALHQLSCSAPKICRLRDWHSVGLAQMEQWVALDNDHVENKLRSLGSEARELAKRPQSARGYVGKEKCSFCSAAVPFESPEVAFCQGVSGRSHKLLRCAVSMRVCPTTPVWFCMCCQRRASEIAPAPLFTMRECPSDFKSYVEQSTLQAPSKPLCPFCGILLQRMQPDFLLSISPV